LGETYIPNNKYGGRKKYSRDIIPDFIPKKKFTFCGHKNWHWQIDKKHEQVIKVLKFHALKFAAKLQSLNGIKN
jgi:hypothetical protein